MSETSKALLMGGDDSTYHDFQRLLPIIRGYLTDLELDVTVTEDPDMFLSDNVRDFHLVVCYTFGHTLNPAQEEGLLDAIKGDPWDEAAKTRGFVGIHGAACSFLNSEAYLRMLGGRFLVHPPMGRLKLEVSDLTHPVMSGVEDFSIEDELYLVEPTSSFNPLLTCDYAGFKRPVVWVKPFGLGKIIYIGLGHAENQLRHRSFQQILQNATSWIAED
jgi:type 1 glutamine amidotransferase